MTKALNDLILLQEKLKILLEQYEFLIEENEVLSKNLNSLYLKYQQKCDEYERIEKEYTDLKQLKTFVGSIEDKRGAKRKINTLIKEIDRCIVELND